MILIQNIFRCSFVFSKTFQYLLKLNSNAGDIEAIVDDLKKSWATEILSHLNVDLKVKGSISNESPMLFVGNHISYLDIPILMAICQDISFIAKKEVSHWPIIGQGAKKIDTIFVKRENIQSRLQAKSILEKSLTEEKKRVVIFPSGTTCLDEAKPWRRGAFAMAAQTQSQLQPFRLRYTPLREVAYIDDDHFVSHLYQLTKLKGIQAEIEFHDPVSVRSPADDCLYWQKWTQRG